MSTGEVQAPLAAADLRLRPPASAVIAETLRLQAGAAPRSRASRLFGRSPLVPEGRSWYLGALGELEVGRVLDELGPEWSVLHAIPVGRRGSDLDHLVVGPGGVFTVNAKHHEGRNVWVGDARLLVNGQGTDHLRNAGFEARRAAKLLSAATGLRVDVTPIVAIVGARRITMRGTPGAVVLRSSQLTRWLSSRRPVLTPDVVALISSQAAKPATWSSVEIPAADLEGFARLREEVAVADRRRFAWGVGVLAVVVGLLAIAVPTLVTALT
jgi:hypothetical protein